MSNKVLLIEDEADIRDVYVEVLQDAGYAVISRSDGDAGLECALNEEWDLLLLDIMLPKRDGVEILTRLKSTDKTKEKPVILLSNLEKSDILQACLSLGAKGFLIKSNIMPGDLVKEVQKNLTINE